MSGIMSMLLGAVSSAAGAIDEFFNRVTLLLPGNGTNGAQNNTFLDSSSNNFTITRNGNTTQGTFSPFSQTGWSNFFDGTGDYLQTASGSSTSFGAGDFCVECWFYKTSSTATGGYLVANLESNSDAQWALMITGTGLIRWQGWNTIWLNPSAPAINQWNHVAVCRSGTTLSLFVNGSRSATLSSHSNNYSATTDVRVGAYASGTDPFTGYISNARVIKGSTPYDPTLTTLTVPTAPLTAITNTSLLTCQSNRFIDNSTNAFAITRNGDTSVQAFSPFAPTAAYSAATVGGSGYFDGSGDYLTAPSNTALTLGTGVFTLEFWAYCTNFSSATRSWLSNRNGTETNRWGIDSSTSGTFYLYGNGGFVVTSSAVAPNQWVHICVTRANTSTNGVRIFINGKLDAVGTSATDFAADIVSIGAAPNGAQPSIGYITDARIIKGSIPTDYQTSSTTTGTQIFTPPLAPITTTSQGATSSNVSLLTNFTNAGITDATAKNVLETVGNAQISTTQSKFGGSSMYFDGTGDYLQYPDSPLWNFGSSDFTIEFWVYPTSFPNYATIISKRVNNSVVTPFDVIILSSGKLLAESWNSGTAIQITSNTTFTLNVWTHVAVVRNGTSLKMYFNGTADSVTGTYASGATLTVNTTPVTIGQDGGTASSNFAGYLDDFRITRYARYTANFTPPTSAFALQ